MSAQAEVTQLLVRWKEGDQAAADQLTPIVYRELHRLAERYLRNERSAQTLQPTALVHELYMELVSHELPDWESRGHFYGIAAHRMRQILVDHARKQNAAKRGAGAEKLELDEIVAFAPQKSPDVVALDDALNALAAFDARKAKIIELRFFGGLSIDETAQAMGVSVATVGRDQRLAEAWLRREMEPKS